MQKSLGQTLVVQRIVEEIKNSLIAGQLKPGDKLPTEKEFAEEFNVSRTPFREAIKMLIAIGVVEIRRGNGTYIREENSEGVVEPIIFSLLLQKRTPKYLLQLRRLLEAGIIELIINKSDDIDFTKLEKTIEEWEKHSGEANRNKRKLVQYDLSFHYACAEATDNPLVIELTRIVMELLTPSITQSITSRGGIKRSIEHHKAILSAMKKKNIQEARQAFDDSLKTWRKYGLE